MFIYLDFQLLNYVQMIHWYTCDVQMSVVNWVGNKMPLLITNMQFLYRVCSVKKNNGNHLYQQ